MICHIFREAFVWYLSDICLIFVWQGCKKGPGRKRTSSRWKATNLRREVLKKATNLERWTNRKNIRNVRFDKVTRVWYLWNLGPGCAYRKWFTIEKLKNGENAKMRRDQNVFFKVCTSPSDQHLSIYVFVFHYFWRLLYTSSDQHISICIFVFHHFRRLLHISPDQHIHHQSDQMSRRSFWGCLYVKKIKCLRELLWNMSAERKHVVRRL